MLAVFLSFWTWVYTYRRDNVKFWFGLIGSVIGLVTTVFLIGFPILFGIWIWSIIDTAVKPEAWYQHYPNQG